MSDLLETLAVIPDGTHTPISHIIAPFFVHHQIKGKKMCDQPGSYTREIPTIYLPKQVMNRELGPMAEAPDWYPVPSGQP